MKKYRLQRIYTTDGKSNIKFSHAKSGVYLIYNSQGTLVYVGMSATQLEKTILRHFQQWVDPKQVRVSYANIKGAKQTYSVRIILCSTTRALALESALILKYKPKDNPSKLALLQPTKTMVTAFNEFKDLPTEEPPF